jgi:aminopeptidase N
MVFLRQPDEQLAGRYLEATARYLAMYEKLLGPYPYGKFALVENFWETGYGMPSFTLLGPRVLRLPFILHSSYPHEILHNWWGNGVFPDYGQGNWAEGLTAYLADHLLGSSRGRARSTGRRPCRSTPITSGRKGLPADRVPLPAQRQPPRRSVTARR